MRCRDRENAASVANPVAARYAYVSKVYETRVPSPAVYAPKGDGTCGQAIAQDTLGVIRRIAQAFPPPPLRQRLQMHRDLTGDETEYNVDFATRDSHILEVATTASTVKVSLYDAADTQIGETVTRNE